MALYGENTVVFQMRTESTKKDYRLVRLKDGNGVWECASSRDALGMNKWEELVGEDEMGELLDALAHAILRGDLKQ